MDRYKKDREIKSFLVGKTIKAVEGSWFTGGITLAFTDDSKMEICPYEEYEAAYIMYIMSEGRI